MSTEKMHGYNYEFVDTPPDRVICAICELPSRDPRITECCGKIVCSACLSHAQCCPFCKAENLVTFCNKQILREVHSLHVFCTNKQRGCAWKGALKDIDSHLEGCLLEVVLCDYQDVGCNVKVVRKRKREHDDEYVKEHLELTKSKLATTVKELELADDRISSLETVVQKLMG